MNSSSGRTSVYLAILTILGIGLRLAAARGELWLDEIWSLTLVAKVSSVWGIFALRHDNNHPLNSLWLYLLGPDQSLYLYRALAVGASSCALLLACRVARRNLDWLQALLLTGMLSYSYVLILYGSEARGYATLMLAISLHVAAYLRFYRSGSSIAAALFWASAWLGILSHLSFVQFYMSLLLADLLSQRGSARRSSRLYLHAPAALGVGAFCLYFGTNLQIGGGVLQSKWDVFLSTFSIGFGGGELRANAPTAGAVYLASAVCIYLMACVEGLLLLRTRRTLGLTLLLLLIAVPVAFVVVLNPRFITVRYLLPTMLAGYVALALLLARLIRRDFGGRILAALIGGVFLAGNFGNGISLLQVGRGTYSSAVRTIAADTLPRTIGAWQTFRVERTLEFYANRTALAEPESITVVSLANQSAQYRWAITTPDEAPPGEDGCSMVAQEGSALLSGFSWRLWRCDAPHTL
ncbi:MAG: hypothetical protein EBZ48_02085 [Proteobacteria bacterium]|nr:hypothetical protein [Pseudomonadota bacterium]